MFVLALEGFNCLVLVSSVASLLVQRVERLVMSFTELPKPLPPST